MERVIACQASAVLAPGKDTRSYAVKVAADWGKTIHSWLETGKVPRGSFHEEATARVQYFPRRKKYPVGGDHEVSFSYDCDTGAIEVWRPTLEIGAKYQDADAWKESRGGSCVTGTCDYSSDLLGIPWVDDLKTGRMPVSPDAPQLAFYALCAWIVAGRPICGAKSSVTTFQRTPVDAEPSREWHVWTPDALEAFEKVLQTTYRRVIELREAKEPITKETANVGPWCRYCPAKTTCQKL